MKDRESTGMRIGIDAHMLGDHSGGNETFYKGILDALVPEEGDQYYIFLNPGTDDSIYRKKFNVYYYRSNNTIMRYLFELPILCKKHSLDILHTQYYIPFFKPCPTVVLIHDISFEHFGEMFKKSELIRNKLLVSYAAKKSDRIITVSEFSKRDITDTYRIPENKISVVYNAVSSEFVRMGEDELNKTDVRSKYGIGNSEFIICVGNLQPRKNIPRLVNAYLEYLKDKPEKPMKLVIAGKKAWLYDESSNAALKDQENIIMTGYVEREDLISLYNLAKGFIYPSVFEGFGIPPLEALACGARVAVSDIPVMHEVIGEQAIYFDPYDVLSIKNAFNLLGDENDRVPINSYEYNIKFSWESSAKKLSQVYKDISRKNK